MDTVMIILLFLVGIVLIVKGGDIFVDAAYGLLRLAVFRS